MSTQPKRRKVAVKKKAAAGQGKRRKKGMTLEDRPLLEPNAGGIDIGAREIFVAVPAERDENPVRVFPTFTEDLKEMARWPVSCGVTTVAMESTGVYWIPVYDVLEQHGVRPCLVNARNMALMPVRPGADCRAAHSAHAKIADANESADPSRHGNRRSRLVVAEGGSSQWMARAV